MFDLKVYLACISLATLRWDWTCASILLIHNRLDSVSHTRLFILNSILVVILDLLATHLHVFFPSMVCVSQERWPFGHCTYLKVIMFTNIFLCCRWGCEHLLHLIDHYPLVQRLFATRSNNNCFLFLFVFFCFLSVYFLCGWSIASCIGVLSWVLDCV